MRLTIFGATGRTGRLLVEQALGNGHTVTAVARHPTRITARDPNLTVVEIPDLEDTDAVRDVLDGREAVLSAIGPRGRGDAPAAAPATRAILAALAATSTRRIVVVSAAPVGKPPDDDSTLSRRFLMPLVRAFLRPVYEDLGAMECELAASETVWTALRPAKLTNGPLTGRYRIAVGSAVAAGYTISRADLAHAMLNSLENPDTERRSVGIAY